MIKNVYVRLGILGAIVAVALISLYPTMVPKDPATGEAILPAWWTKIKALPQKRINLGLDLRGGVYLVYTVKLNEAIVMEGRRIIEFLDNDILVNQLASLERRTRSGGKDIIDHPTGGKDDVANAIAGVSYITSKRRLRVGALFPRSVK